MILLLNKNNKKVDLANRALAPSSELPSFQQNYSKHMWTEFLIRMIPGFRQSSCINP